MTASFGTASFGTASFGTASSGTPAPMFTIVFTPGNARRAAAGIRTVLAQTDRDFELVVVDCGTTDEVADVTSAAGDARVVCHRARGGVAPAAQFTAAAGARGDVVLFVSDRDELLPTALALVREAFAAGERAAVVGGVISVSGDRRDWSARGPDVSAALPGWPDALPAGNVAVKRAQVGAAVALDRIGVVPEPIAIRYAGPALGGSNPNPAADVPARTSQLHGVLVTFDRPELLAKMLVDLEPAGLGSLTIVDNAPSAESTRIALGANAALHATYVPMPENTGPAGGIEAGMTRVLEHAHDDDWICIFDDDGLGGSSATPGRLREYGEWLIERGAPVGAVGLVGARLDRRSGKLVRPHDDELVGPVTLDYIAGGQMLTIRVAAARATGVFDPDYFFGFDDLDYCLRLARNGYRVYADGPAWFEERRKHGRLGTSVGRASRRMSAWRRYYGVRNHIVIIRRYASWPAAIAVTVAHLFGRPFVDLVKRQPGWRALTAAGTRGCFDAWTGRLGRRVEPPPATPDAS